jgi:3-hydroxybutyryl-CoA dehydrogenase
MAEPTVSPAVSDVRRDIRRIGVVGCGQMGSGIANICARARLDVVVRETDVAASLRGQRNVTASLESAVRRSLLTPGERDLTMDRIRFTTDWADLADCDTVIEAVAEEERAKTEVFAALDAVLARADAILATNTSSLPVMKLAMTTERPEQVIGIHFFNPVPILNLVELVPSLMTSEETVLRARTLVTDALGKQVITARDRSGFVVNYLLVPYLLSAIRLIESGSASAQDVDTGMVVGCAHPMGPLRLADLIGLDTVKAIADSMYEEYKEPLYSPPPLLSRMVDAGLLGKKSGRGFHEYNPRPAAGQPV